MLVKNSRRSVLTKLTRSFTETRGDRVLGCLGWVALLLRLLFLTAGDLEITLSVVSLGKAILVALPPSASLASEDFRSEVMVTLPLARSGTLLFSLLRRYLALHSAPVPASRLRTLIVSLDTGAALAMLSAIRTPLNSAHRGGVSTESVLSD